MICVRLMGGLGNQMFQYAVARRLAVRHATETVLDTSFFDNRLPGVTPRKYELDVFPIAGRLATPVELTAIRRSAATGDSFLARLKGRVSRQPALYYWREAGPGFLPQTLDLPDNVCLDGYWQSEKYFATIRATLGREFAPSAEATGDCARILEEIGSVDAVAVHFRRGDYVSQSHTAAFHGLLPTAYYSAAFALLRERVKAPRLFVFSDDPRWVRDNVALPFPATIVSPDAPGAGAARDLHLMRHCRHAVIANSSFSWWGAWLIDTPGKVVIAPQRWFADPGLVSPDLLPADWIKVDWP